MVFVVCLLTGCVFLSFVASLCLILVRPVRVLGRDGRCDTTVHETSGGPAKDSDLEGCC